MPDREKVVQGLEHCVGEEHANCENCPYLMDVVGVGCYTRLKRDALALLKEQEARVMMREEVIDLPEGAVVWFEERSDDSRDYIGPLVSDGNGYFGDFGRGVDMHAAELKRQRCWTSRPTPEQMRETPWEDVNGD